MAESKEDFSPEKCLISQALLQHQIQTQLWSENTSYQKLVMNLRLGRKMEMHFLSLTIIKSLRNDI